MSTGKQPTSGHATVAQGRPLVELGDRRPAPVRGDSGCGNEGILVALEEPGQRYLLRLRQTANAKRRVAKAFGRTDWSWPDTQGCQRIEGQVRLRGWSKTRPVEIVRQRIRGGIARQRCIDNRQLQRDLQPAVSRAGDKLWEYAVLVTGVQVPIEAVALLYRDRADVESAFDVLKNPWGRGGFATQDIKRCQTMARAWALVYNGWSWYCPTAHPHACMEAITSRPLPLAAVGKAVNHANQTALYLTPLHGKAHVLKTLTANIGAALQHVRAAAEQFTQADRWGLLVRYVSDRVAPAIGPFRPPDALPASA